MLILVVESVDSSMNLIDGERGIIKGGSAWSPSPSFFSRSPSSAIFDLLTLRPLEVLLEGDPEGEKVDFFFFEGLTTTLVSRSDDLAAFSASKTSDLFLKLSGLRAPT